MYEFLMICYAGYLVWEYLGRPPVAASYWYYLMKDYQRAARFFGLLGMSAELAYHDAMQKVTLA